MSNIYIQEPPTNGKVLLVTSCGDIDIELWSKEAPKACRNFVQLCMENYYDGLIFHRVVKEFIVQGGDPTGTGHGGESVYDRPFKDEFHQRLRFVRRGLVAMANAGPNDNGSQFFFTLGPTQELQNKHTIFGKVSGNTVYNMLKLQECETDAEDRPLYPNKIVRTEILANPYDDIIPRANRKLKKEGEGEFKPKSKSRATKNFKLLSFGEEAEEDEEQDEIVSKGWKGKSKSSHDLANDPRLSSRPAMDVSPDKAEKRKGDSDDPIDSEEEMMTEEDKQLEDKLREERMENVRKKLKKDTEPVEIKKITTEIKKNVEIERVIAVKKITPETKASPDVKKTVEKPAEIKKPIERKKSPVPPPAENVDKKPISRSEELKQEAKQLKKDIRDSKKRSEQRKNAAQTTEEVVKTEEAPVSSDPLADFKRERLKYKAMRKQQGKKGANREEITLSLLDKFKSKLNTVRTVAGEYGSDEEQVEEEEEEKEMDPSDLSWMHHKLQFDEAKNKVLDANIHDVDRYEIHDPRNPLTKRRREESKLKMKGKK